MNVEDIRRRPIGAQGGSVESHPDPRSKKRLWIAFASKLGWESKKPDSTRESTGPANESPDIIPEITTPQQESDGEIPRLSNDFDVESDYNEITQISDILYGSPGERQSPIVYADMKTIYEWRQHPRIFGHIYPRIKDDPKADREFQRVSQWEYYLGVKDTDGKPREGKDAVFFEVIHSSKEMLAVGSLILNGVPFIPQGRRIAYAEQVIRNPNPVYEDQKIGSALLIEMLDYAFYRCTRYQGGRSAVEVRASTIVDREAGEFNINELWLRRAGFKHDGNVIWIRETPGGPEIPIQPWKLTLADYEEARPDAVNHIGIKQPQWADRLERIWPELQRQLSERISRLPEGKSSSNLQD